MGAQDDTGYGNQDLKDLWSLPVPVSITQNSYGIPIDFSKAGSGSTELWTWKPNRH